MAREIATRGQLTSGSMTGSDYAISPEGTMMSAASCASFVSGVYVTYGGANRSMNFLSTATPMICCDDSTEPSEGFPKPSKQTSRSSETSGENIAPKSNAPEKSEGLCSTCSKREYCKIPRPEGGVWHCKEYE